MMIMNEVLKEVNRQEQLWGRRYNQADPIWLAILMEEVGEVADAYLNSSNGDTSRIKDMKVELIQCAAVIYSWLRNIEERGTNERV